MRNANAAFNANGRLELTPSLWNAFQVTYSYNCFIRRLGAAEDIGGWAGRLLDNRSGKSQHWHPGPGKFFKPAAGMILKGTILDIPPIEGGTGLQPWVLVRSQPDGCPAR